MLRHLNLRRCINTTTSCSSNISSSLPRLCANSCLNLGLGSSNATAATRPVHQFAPPPATTRSSSFEILLFRRDKLRRLEKQNVLFARGSYEIIQLTDELIALRGSKTFRHAPAAHAAKLRQLNGRFAPELVDPVTAEEFAGWTFLTEQRAALEALIEVVNGTFVAHPCKVTDESAPGFFERVESPCGKIEAVPFNNEFVLVRGTKIAPKATSKYVAFLKNELRAQFARVPDPDQLGELQQQQQQQQDQDGNLDEPATVADAGGGGGELKVSIGWLVSVDKALLVKMWVLSLGGEEK